MIKFYFPLLLLLSSLISKSQICQWAVGFNGSAEQRTWAIKTDNLGNIFTTGYFNGVADFDPSSGSYTLTSRSFQDYDCFVSKLDKNGNFVWAKDFGGAWYTYGYSIGLDGSGNVYVAGFFTDTADFDPGPGVNTLIASGTDGFIVKLDTSGNFVWAKQLSCAELIINSITFDSNNNILTTGYFRSSADFDPGIGSNILSSAPGPGPFSYLDIFILKLDQNGNFIWAKNFGGGGVDDYGFAIATDLSNNVYVTGVFKGIADFDPGLGIVSLNSSQGGDFLVKLDANANLVYAKNFSGPPAPNPVLFDGKPKDIVLDMAGNIYTSGNFKGTADFDPGPGTYTLTSAFGDDVFISKFDPGGSLIWAKNFEGSTSDQRHTALALDALGNVYTCGKIDGTIDFDPGPGTYTLTTFTSSVTTLDIYVAKLDPNGNFIWATKTDGPGNDLANCIASDASGSFYISGYFTNTCEFNSPPSVSVTAGTSFSAYVAKYYMNSVNVKNLLDNKNEFLIYPNPTSEKIYFKEVVRQMEIFDINGNKIKSFGNVSSIDVSNFSNGIYFIRIKTEKGEISKKFVKD